MPKEGEAETLDIFNAGDAVVKKDLIEEEESKEPK